ncbi:hypothetical protein VaNZ11_015629 [Volvox africanus]|uniref:GRIP domain-containing protein n=1 Tax=Volvox africanus TaxID=51714 RepID=A0ABQ5SLZ4_9CHLO|nr:hypothetical protein VaNZ11_015629 [Volvox africanus]
MDKLVGAFSGVLKTSNAPTSQTAALQGDRQYLRLPLESARKLRWFEKADLQALTKSHFREKRELLDTLTVLKKLLVRHGLDEAKLDVEVAAHLRTAQELAEEHEGVASVLLAALEPQVQQLRFENERLQAAIRTGQHAALTKCSPSRADGQVLEAADGRDMTESLSVGGSSPPHVLASTAPVPRRLEHLDLAQVRCSASARMDPLVQQQLTALETQCAEYAKEVSELKVILAKQQQQQQQAAAAGRRRTPEANAPMQDVLLSLQEVAREEARKAALADARAMRLEGELKALQGQHKAIVKENAVLQQQVTQLREEVEAAATAAEARVAEAAAAGEGSRATAEAREEAAALRQINTTLRAELSSAQGCISRLEADMQLSQQRVATSAAALAEAEALARRSDGLAAANVQLMQRLAESKTELEMATYYKKVCSELTEAKSLLEEQLLSLGSLLSASELKLADMAARATAAEEHAAVAECRARAAESSIAAEVERRCGTALSSRALWPPALRDEVDCLEARLGRAEAALSAAEQRAEVAIRTEAELREQLHVKAEELAVITQESAAATTSFAAQLQQLREALAESQARTAGLQDDLIQSRAREEAAAAAAAAAADAAGPSHVTQRRHSSGGNTNGVGASSFSASTAVMTPKWQIQNKVGGGGLYNLDAEMGDGAGRSNGSSVSSRVPTAGSTGSRAAMSNVDAVYMKNVLFKFLEAHLTNKAQERDMLLPAIATLLQATQEEYIALQKILRATMPPSRQMLSVFGLSR